MNRSILLVLAVFSFVLGCDKDKTTPTKPLDSGITKTDSAWDFYTLDNVVNPGSGDVELQASLTQLSLAVGPDDRVGVGFFRPNGKFTTKPAYDILYVEWKAGVVGTPEPVRNITGEPAPMAGATNLYVNPEGISLAFQASGEPAVAYLGGYWDGSPSPAWYQADAAVAYRQGGTWQPEWLVARSSSDATCNCTGEAVSSSGQIVGLWPSLVIEGATFNLVYRDVHNGQSTGTGDYTASELEMGYGSPGSGKTDEMIVSGADDKMGWGAHNRLIAGDGTDLAVTSDHVVGNADGPGANPFFRLRHNGTWSAPPVGQDIFNDLGQSDAISDAQSGPSVAYDATLGYGVAVVNRSRNILYYTQSSDPLHQWLTSTPVVGNGTTGWYPSLAFDPVAHEPNIAYYHCSDTSGKNEGECTSEDELRVVSFTGADWNYTTVDPDGAFQPQLAYLSTGKRVIAYRVGNDATTLRLAVEK